MDNESLQDRRTWQEYTTVEQIVFSLRKQVIGESPELGLLRQPGGKLALGHLIELLKSQVVQDILAVLYIVVTGFSHCSTGP